MNPRKKAVTFQNRDGRRLFGILHEPSTGPASDIAFVLLPPGIKGRIAPHRLYNDLTDKLTARGHAVFRFDFWGLGDSEGEVEERELRDLYTAVALGRYVNDTRDALDWLSRTCHLRHFVIGGLCGGAVTGILEAQSDPRVVGILSIGLPVMLDSNPTDAWQYMTTGQLNDLGSRYVAKILSPQAWLRFLSFRTDYRLLLRSIRVRLGLEGPAPIVAAPPQQPVLNANPHLPGAILKLLARGTPMLLLFSEADRLYWEFEEKFLSVYGHAFRAHAGTAEIRVIQAANHVLTFKEWQHDCFNLLGQWLEARFPASVPVAP